MSHPVEAKQVLETCVYAKDLHAAKRFYENVLGLQPFAEVNDRHVFFRCGETVFLVFNPEVTRIEDPDLGVPAHGAVAAGHVCFTMKENKIDSWRSKLSDEGVPIERELTWPSGGFSLYFRDPAGNSVELATRKTWNLAE
jgi:catechol 2,3-dioxygenase-like lactoylglutathione lyase family enzyme